MNSKLDPIFNKEEIKFSRLALDQLKEQDLKVLFETLMTEPPLRTIADINALIKILLSVPVPSPRYNPSKNYATTPSFTTYAAPCSSPSSKKKHSSTNAKKKQKVYTSS